LHTVSITFVNPDAPEANIYQVSSGERFIVLNIGQGVSIMPFGRDMASVDHATAIAVALIGAANSLEQSLKASKVQPSPNLL
jgi:hypothetical protein